MTVLVNPRVYHNYINGEWVSTVTNNVGASMNPANFQEVVGYVQMSSEEDVNLAVQAAKIASQEWKRLSAPERGNYLYKISNIIEIEIDRIAETMTREMGKTISEAKGEVTRGVAILRYYAGEGMRKVGEVIPSTDQDALMFTTRCPLGVIGVISPWNFPVAIPIWKMAPALVYGNTIVFKPALESSVTAALIIECFHKAGLPSGVVNLVTGKGTVIGHAITNHSDVNGITFTGSNHVGKQIGIGAFKRGAKYQLEMGGKNPIIIANDADLHLAVEATINGGLRSTGQKCTATSRVIIHSDIYEEFRDLLIAKIKEVQVGNGLDSSTWMGPCASEKQLETVLTYIKKGNEEGANLLLGGKRLTGDRYDNGFYVEPTIFDQVVPSMTIAKEEIFGPVLSLIKVDSIEEALTVANDTDFGLSASIFTRDVGNILSFITQMEAGLIRINSETAGVELQAPFGGMKQSSSHSREQGQAAIEFFTSVKTVFVKG